MMYEVDLAIASPWYIKLILKFVKPVIYQGHKYKIFNGIFYATGEL